MPAFPSVLGLDLWCFGTLALSGMLKLYLHAFLTAWHNLIFQINYSCLCSILFLQPAEQLSFCLIPTAFSTLCLASFLYCYTWPLAGTLRLPFAFILLLALKTFFAAALFIILLSCVFPILDLVNPSALAMLPSLRNSLVVLPFSFARSFCALPALIPVNILHASACLCWLPWLNTFLHPSTPSCSLPSCSTSF